MNIRLDSETVGHLDKSSRTLHGLGLIGVGAFGRFCLPYLAPHFAVVSHDSRRALPDDPATPSTAVDIVTAAAQEIVVLAVPYAQLAEVAAEISPHLQPRALVVDVCSIKEKPLQILRDALPAHVDIVGTHPLFGPQSGRDGIAGLRIAVCHGRGRRSAAVARFLRRRLDLTVIETSPQEHDRQMAQVQGLTHLLARIVASLDLPPVTLATSTYEQLDRMVGTVRDDSDALYRLITEENAFAREMKDRLLRAARDFCA